MQRSTMGRMSEAVSTSPKITFLSLIIDLPRRTRRTTLYRPLVLMLGVKGWSRFDRASERGQSFEADRI